VTVACIVISVYLFIFMINQQYMLKVIRRFSIRFLNHNGDYANLAVSIVLIAFFLFFRYAHTFSVMSLPLVDYTAIVPRGNAVYAYYGITNPKIRKEQ
jgi:hypothetical protein